MAPPKKANTSATSKPSSKQTKLKILYRRRTNILGSANLIKTFDDAFDPTKGDQLPIRIHRLDALWHEFEETQEEIEILEDEEEDFTQEREEFQTLYFELKASLQSKLPAPVPPPAQAPPISSAVPISSSVRLPEIKLKEFSGNLDDWVSFRDLYVSLIHSSVQLTAVQKMHYLRATLSGEAARIISSLEISANNYLVAWNLLKERYENSKLLVKRHMSAILTIPSLKKESAQGLADLADEFDRHVQLLDKLEDSENHWNAFLVERLSQCLDAVTLREWETHVSEGEEYPKYQELLEFIHRRSRIAQTLKLSQLTSTQSENKQVKPRSVVSHVVSDNAPSCACCQQAHFLFQCEQFHSLSPQQRFEVAKKRGLCINCLKGTHQAKNCSSGSCKSCSRKHHSLLHLPPLSSASGSQPAATTNQSASTHKPAEANTSQSCQISHFVPNLVERSPPEELALTSPPVSSSVRSQSSRGKSFPFPSVDLVNTPSTACQSAEVLTQPRQSTVILSTAVIKVKDVDNKYILARALLDSGSQPSFISEALCQRLRLKRTKLNSPVSGIGQSVVNVHYGVTLSIASRFETYSAQLDCLVLPKLTVSLPSHHIDVTQWRIPRNLPLADPQFNISQGVDIIIGAALFFELLEHQQFTLASGYPSLQKTVLGYIVCGKLEQPTPEATETQTSHICVEDRLDSQLQRFWEIENFDDGKALTPDEQHCEDHFKSTVARDETGRYVVRLPLKEDQVSMLGDSYTTALPRFQQLEKGFTVDEDLRRSYPQFMEEYESLGHMESVSVASRSPRFFLPHHAIQRPESKTTKTRVVFDSSCHSAAPLSRNDTLHVGPTVQPALLTSQSRVAPLCGQSISRLELSAALLGSQLVHNLLNNTNLEGPITFWTDSTVALHWIKSRLNSWKVFVSNRVAEIQRLTKGSQWMHVPTELNPADHISRGMLASQVLHDKLWWHGLAFLTSPVEMWPKCAVSMPTKSELEEEMRPLVSLHSLQEKSDIFSQFSELAKLTRVVAYCFRLRNNCKLPKNQRVLSPLSPQEVDSALKSLVRLAQRHEFPTEVRLYSGSNSQNAVRVASKSPLKNLNIIMDEFGLLRIDGRLKNLDAPFDTRHPILLLANHQLSWLIARSVHLQTLHGGPSLLLATVRQRFWPLRGRELARKVVHHCVTCFRCNPTPASQIMAPLPSVRLKPARAFTYSGMDYCGSFLVSPLIGKGSSVKVYVALFVCLVVKAVHLEVVADLSTVSCINAVKRFVAYRGRVLDLHCDNATAFIGADRELRKLRKEYRQQFKSAEWGEYCAGSGITFKLIPARSSHFGGLWEAEVKSFKYRFRRIMGQKAFSMDQLRTLAAQIKSVLNSRPVVPISDSPNDLSALTPGHFLIGEPLVSIPEPDLLHLSPNRLTRLQDMRRSVQDLWRSWSRDYVSQLRQRTKWLRPSVDVRKGQLVLLKEDNYPPLQWPLGRIIETVTGSDGRVRVVVARTASGEYKRAITKVAVLPIDSEDDDPASTSTGDVVVG